MKAIINGNIITGNGIVSGKKIIFNEKIIEITDEINEKYKDIEVVDAKGEYISPGLIDIHIHGFAGADIMDGIGESVDKIARELTKYGVTSFLGATMTAPVEEIEKALKCIQAKAGNSLGAEILGAYMEGPFLSKDYRGAHKEELIIPPYLEIVQEYSEVIKVVVYAPENDEKGTFAEQISEMGLIPAAGHSGCAYETALKAFEMGTKLLTHTFNAMKPLHHREPGLLTAALNSDIYCELIADNIHVSGAMYPLLLKLKGIEKIILVSDAMRGAGLADGEYELGGQRVRVEGSKAVLADGTLAGAVTPLNCGLANLINETGIDINEAVKTVTANPAKLLGIYGKKGVILPEADADIIIFDKNINIKKVFVKGAEQ